MKTDARSRDWIAARQRHRLSHAHVQMARELGMNPRKLGGLDNHRQEPWKLPLTRFIEELYLQAEGGKAATDEPQESTGGARAHPAQPNGSTE